MMTHHQSKHDSSQSTRRIVSAVRLIVPCILGLMLSSCVDDRAVSAPKTATNTARWPTDEGVPFKQWYMRTQNTDGSQLAHYIVEYGVEAKPGQTVIVLHGGWGAEHSYLIPAIRPIADTHRFVLYDQRGSLRTPVSPPAKISYSALVEDLEQLRQRLGLDKVTLMVDLTAPIADSQLSRPPRGVQICLDISGSMSGAPLAAAKESILKLVDRLDKKDTFGIVIFDDTAKVAVPTRPLIDHNMAQLKKSIRNIQSGGSTDISAGFTLAMREAGRVKLEGGTNLLLISDGHANAGEQDPQFFADVAAKSATESITSASIGLGNGYDETILEAIAQGGGGAHRFAADIDEAVGAIAAEVDDLLDKAIVNCVMRFRPTALAKGQPKICYNVFPIGWTGRTMSSN